MYEALKYKKRSIILDTDIGPDCDDVGAIAVLISYAKEYGNKILGICNCTSNIYGTATIDALKDYCKADDFVNPLSLQVYPFLQVPVKTPPMILTDLQVHLLILR